MPYAPGVQNISGQLAAQGILARGQAYGNAIGNVASGVQDFMKREEERAKTVGAIQGFLNDPYYQQQISRDPLLSATGEKIKAGKAGLNEVQQFLGSLTAAGHARDQQMKQDQLNASIAYNTALTEQAKANKLATDAATAERTRQNALSDQMLKTVAEFSDLEKLQNSTGFSTFEQEDRYNQLKDNPLLMSVRQGKEVGLDPISSIKVFQNEENIRQRSELARMQDETRRLASENAALKNVKFNAGDTRQIEIDGKKITAVWDGKEYIDQKTGAPIYTTIETSDPAGNRMSVRGQLNPEIATAYGIPSRAMAKSPFLPGMGGGTTPGMGGATQEGEPKPSKDNVPNADRATQARYPVPNGDAVRHLLQNPQLSGKFDELFGPGAAARVMMQQGNLMRDITTSNSNGVQLTDASQFLPQ